MNICFFHGDKLAVSKCFSCHRPLCEECVKKTDIGDVCSDECYKKVKSFLERNPREKNGKRKKVSFFRYRILWWWKVLILLLVFYFFMYFKYGLTSPREMFTKLLDLFKEIF